MSKLNVPHSGPIPALGFSLGGSAARPLVSCLGSYLQNGNIKTGDEAMPSSQMSMLPSARRKHNPGLRATHNGAALEAASSKSEDNSEKESHEK